MLPAVDRPPEPQVDATSRLDFATLPPVPDHGSPRAAEWWLAMGHLRSGNERFLSVVTLISILGVLVGVALLNTVVAVMNGFEIDLRDKILGANAHVVVMRYGGDFDPSVENLDKITGVSGVTSAAPFTYAEMMLRSKYATSGVIFKGIDPARTGDVTEVREQLTLGIGGKLTDDDQKRALFEAMSRPFPAPGGGAASADDEALPGMLMGDELMADLQVLPGDVVQVIDPVGKGVGALGVPTPRFKTFRVAGAFHSGMFEYDTKWVYVAIPDAQTFLDRGPFVTGVEVRVDDIDEVERISREIELRLGYPHYARHWKNLNQALFEALALEKIVMGLILGMVIVVAGLLIVSNLYMMVLTKRREVAILKAMGASNATIRRVFVLVGSVIGLIGTTLGTGLGMGLCAFLDRYEYPLETDIYFVSTLPVVVQPADVIVTAVAALGICFLSTLYPAWRAASLDPVEGLRYE